MCNNCVLVVNVNVQSLKMLNMQPYACKQSETFLCCVEPSEMFSSGTTQRRICTTHFATFSIWKRVTEIIINGVIHVSHGWELFTDKKRDCPSPLSLRHSPAVLPSEVLLSLIFFWWPCRGKFVYSETGSLKRQSCFNTLLIKTQQGSLCSNRLQMWMQEWLYA